MNKCLLTETKLLGTIELLIVVAALFLGGAVMALHAAQGPQLGLPQMISSRVQFGVYGALDGAAGRRHSLGYIRVTDRSLTERAVISALNFVPVSRSFFLYQASEYDLVRPAGQGRVLVLGTTLDRDWTRPLVSALKKNQLAALTLVSCNRDSLLTTQLTAASRWRFCGPSRSGWSACAVTPASSAKVCKRSATTPACPRPRISSS